MGNRLGVYRKNEISEEYIKLFTEVIKQEGFEGVFFINTKNMDWEEETINKYDYCEGNMEYPPNFKGGQKLDVLYDWFVKKREHNKNILYLEYQNFASYLIDKEKK